MNSATPPLLKPRRRTGWWVLLGLALLTAPFVFVGVAAVSMLTLDRDAAVLRREVMAATEGDWHTKVQMSVGGITLGAVRAGLQFIQADHMDEARLALKAVRGASVGVYECNDGVGEFSHEQLFTRTDKKMKARGWTRLVGVVDSGEAVLIYTSDELTRVAGWTYAWPSWTATPWSWSRPTWMPRSSRNWPNGTCRKAVSARS